jgi:hypothetical protein
MTIELKKFKQIEKELCDRIKETDILRDSLTDYQWKKYKTFRNGYLTALIDIQRILEKEFVESE